MEANRTNRDETVREMTQRSSSSLPQIATDSGHERWIQSIALIGGVAVVLAAVSPPFDSVADRSFSAHMLQHMLLTNLAAVLLAVAWPLIFGRWRNSNIVGWLNRMASPAPALLLVVSSGVLWFWHIPAVYDDALDHPAIHALQHLLFLGAFVLYWRPVMRDSMSGDHLRSNEGRVLYLTVGMLAMGLLAANIMFADHLIYPHYEQTVSGGRTPMQDQALGGAIMLLVGAVSTVVVAILTLRDEPSTDLK